MNKNEGKWDRIARIVLGIGILSMAFVGPQTAWGYLGVIPLLTGAIGYCPLYSLFGWNTCPMARKS